MNNKEFTARELMNKLMELNEKLYEEVLDTISDHYNSLWNWGGTDGYFAWDEGKNGNMLMYIEGEEE